MDKNIDRSAKEIDRAARESYRTVVDRAFDAQKSSMRLSRRFFENWIETLEDRAQLNRRTSEGLAELVREQQEVFRRISQESGGAYDDFVESLSSYYQQLVAAEEGSEAERPTDRQGQASEVTVWKGTGRGAREGYLSLLERTGEIKSGSRELPADFWDLPRPEDPDASVRRAVQEDRR